MKENKMEFKSEIQTGAFLGFVAGVIGFIVYNSEGVVWWDFSDFNFKLITWIVFWSMCLVFGIKKEGAFRFIMNAYRILTSHKLTTQEKFHMLMSIIQQWLGIVADMSIVLNEQAKEVKEIKEEDNSEWVEVNMPLEFKPETKLPDTIEPLV